MMRAARTLLNGKPYLFAIAVLAIAIGMSTAVFSLAQAVLFHALPFPQQDAIRVIWKADARSGVPFLELAYPELHDLQRGVPAFESVAVMPTTLYGYGRVMQIGDHEPVQIESAPASLDFFRTLGVKPMLGRDFADTDQHPGAAPVVILSFNVWQSQFHGNTDIIGRQITLNGAGHLVIGIMSREVDFPRGVGLWTPMGIRNDLESRGAYFMQAIARVKPGYSDDQVKAQVNGLVKRLAFEYPAFYSPTQEAVITPLTRYWTGSARLQLIASLAASLLLLVTGCITASNLFLARTLARQQEIATRSSLGATTLQISAQFLAEGFTAAVAAGVAGVAIAWTLIKILVASAPSEIPRLTDASIDLPVLTFAALLSLIVAIACSVAPALIARRVNLHGLLREGGTRLTGTRHARRMQGAFTTAQIAVTVVLLTASVLIVVTVRSMLKTDIGFAHRDALTMNLALKGPQSGLEQRRSFYTHLLNGLRESPGVTSAGAVLVRPLEGSIGWDMSYYSEFETPEASKQVRVSNFEVVSPGYFQTVGTPLLEGRDFTDHDSENAEKTVVISHGLAQRLRSSGHPVIGTRIRFGRRAEGDWWKIIGVTGNTRYRGITTRDEDIYACFLQSSIPVNYLVIRGRQTPAELAALVRRHVAALNPNQAIANVATIQELVDKDTARQRFNMVLLLTFGLSALVLAAAGVYSVVAEDVSGRNREIAIRIALGAERPALVRTLVSSILRFVMIGEFVGLFTSLAVGRLFSNLLYGVDAHDPLVLSTVLGFLFVVAASAGSIPAWLASGKQPRTILH